VHGLPVDLAFELNHRVQRNTEVVPAPVIELGLFDAGSQPDIAVLSEHAQEIPDLFLSAVESSPFAPHPPRGDIVMEPVLGAGQQPHMLRPKAGLFVELAIHRLLWVLAVLNAALRELPGLLTDAFSPEDLVDLVDENDADVGPVAMFIQHNAQDYTK